MKKIEITKMLGGGTSWYYAIDTSSNEILGSSHEDDKEGMARLKKNPRRGNMRYKVEVARISYLTVEVDEPKGDEEAAREKAVEQATHFTEQQWKDGYTEIESQGCTAS